MSNDDKLAVYYKYRTRKHFSS